MIIIYVAMAIFILGYSIILVSKDHSMSTYDLIILGFVLLVISVLWPLSLAIVVVGAAVTILRRKNAKTKKGEE